MRLVRAFEHYIVYAFDGPGLPQHANEVSVLRECDAETISRLIRRSYEAGKREGKAEVREALGL